MGEIKDDWYFESEVLEILGNLGESFKDQEGVTFTAGISSNFYNHEGASSAYNQAVLAAQRRFYEGKGILIQYVPENCCYKSVYEKQFIEDVDELKAFIEIGDASKAKRSILCLLEKIRNENIEPEQFREICSRILSRVFGLLPEFSDVSKEYYENNNNDVFFYIREINTYKEVSEYIYNFFYDMTQRLNCIRAKRSKKIIELAKDYIETHFREDVNLNSVAEKVYLNQFYFSNLFKSETGKNFTDFLVGTRINEAKKLLKRPDLKVYEIGQMVGYEEPVSFNRAFKRVVGISPAEYRKVIK
jgi:two-component system response regulator YesN